ncbi:MAG: carboxypeptidase regulatory-like domain-containing protein [Ignavibacteriae bacterium]|nr:carboxypeptidase regulatory-like domain-containing protein [Ignavibacteriota bacterium]
MTRFLSFFLIALIFVSGSFAQTLPTPTNLHVVASSNSGTLTGAYLTWQAATGNWRYRVYRSADDSAHFAALGTTSTKSYLDGTIVRGTRYYYYVKSYRDSIESGRSNIANILLPTLPPLPTPSNLTATLVISAYEFHPSVKLKWNGGRGWWRYKIFRSVNNPASFRVYGSTQDTTFVDNSVKADSTYRYYVRAWANDTTLSPQSNTVEVLVTLPYRPKGTIRGTVVDDSTSAPIRNVMISFFRNATCSNTQPVKTDSLGRYTAQLDTGRYIIRAAGPHGSTPGISMGYRPEYFDNCFEPSCATVVALGDSQVFTANFGLSRPTPPVYVTVSGVVTDTANVPLRNARVSVIRTVQEMNFLASLGITPGVGSEALTLEGLGHTRGVMWNGKTDSLGRYNARVIGNNRYIAVASKESFLPEYYNNKPSVELADIIVLGTRDTSGISFSLAIKPVPNNSIAGLVRDSLGVGVPSRVALIPARHNSIPARYVHTDSLGAYSITGVVEGKYFVFAMPFSGYGHAYYKAGAYGITRKADADTVSIVGNITGINIGVKPVTSSGLTLVRGIVRTNTSAAIPGVEVTAFNAEGDIVSIGTTDATGAYMLDAVEPGVIAVAASRYGYNDAQSSVTIEQNLYTMDNVNLTLVSDGVTSVISNVAPNSFALMQNYPNPFNPNTTIRFDIPFASKINVKIFNVLGQEVAQLVNDVVAAGQHQVVWNGTDGSGRSVASGIYFYRLNAASSADGSEFTSIKKMLLVK